MLKIIGDFFAISYFSILFFDFSSKEKKFLIIVSKFRPLTMEGSFPITEGPSQRAFPFNDGPRWRQVGSVDPTVVRL